MRHLSAGLPPARAAGSTPSRRGSSVAAPTRSFSEANLPTISNRLTDVEIPRRVWSNWIPSFGERALWRSLEPDERAALERRRDELALAVAPYHPSERDRVAVALLRMFGSYTSMRQDEEAAAAKIDSAANVLVDFPAWAIEKACAAIHRNGVWRGDKFDRQWPPNDSEIIEAVRDARRLIGDQYDSAVAILNAKVEPGAGGSNV